MKSDCNNRDGDGVMGNGCEPSGTSEKLGELGGSKGGTDEHVDDKEKFVAEMKMEPRKHTYRHLQTNTAKHTVIKVSENGKSDILVDFDGCI